MTPITVVPADLLLAIRNQIKLRRWCIGQKKAKFRRRRSGSMAGELDGGGGAARTSTMSRARSRRRASIAGAPEPEGQQAERSAGAGSASERARKKIRERSGLPVVSGIARGCFYK
jgi:hypothetical protein